MFDIGFFELLLIAVVALLVVGPERLPDFARETGRWLRRLRRFTRQATRELSREWQLDEDLNDSKNALQQKLRDVEKLLQNAPDRQAPDTPEADPDNAGSSPDPGHGKPDRDKPS